MKTSAKPLTAGIQGYKHLDSLTALFVATIMTSNLLSSAKLVDLGIHFFSLPLVFDGGLVIFPICYIFGDILTEVYGYSRTRKLIWLGFLATSLLSLTVLGLKFLPGEPSWRQAGGDQAYSLVLGGLASGAIVLASLSAYLVGEFANSYLVAKLKIYQKGKKMWVRFLGSTLVGQMLDNLIFFSLTILLGVFPGNLFFSLFITNYLVKIGLECLLLPITYKVVLALKRAEQEDTYDIDTNFNPLALTN